MSHAEDICQHVVMIHQGRKVLDEPTVALRRRFDPRALRFEPLNPNVDLSPITELAEVQTIERTDTGTRCVSWKAPMPPRRFTGLPG